MPAPDHKSLDIAVGVILGVLAGGATAGAILCFIFFGRRGPMSDAWENPSLYIVFVVATGVVVAVGVTLKEVIKVLRRD